MGVLDCGTLAIRGFWDNFSMNEAEAIWSWVEEVELPDAIICNAGKHFIEPRLEMMWEMGNVASAITRAHELTTEVRETFGDLSLMAWWWADSFDRSTIEMAQEALTKAVIGREVREECERKLDWALFFLTNAETIAQGVVESL